MKIHAITLSVTELQDALRQYAERTGFAQVEYVYVDNGFDKRVLVVPLTPGAVVSGAEFQRQTEAS